MGYPTYSNEVYVTEATKADTEDFHTSDPNLLNLLHFQKYFLIRGRVITGFSGLEKDIFLGKLEVQGWTKLFLQGDVQ